jgi:C-terminal processing protease CtpA/Prc
MQKAERLLGEALTFMEKNYYRRDEISWPDFTARAQQQLRAAGNCDDAYASISWCLKQLNEPHSFVMPPGTAAHYTGYENNEGPEPPLSELVGEIKGEWIRDSIGYLTIPWVNTEDSLVSEHIADSLQDLIARLDARGISKWIIDLRKNSGGNCWPMLTGIGPLLGDGVCGYFVQDSRSVPISYHDGSALQGRHVRCRVSSKGYHLQHKDNFIVVLIGGRTISAGETAALAFKGKTQTCFIGEPTRGLTTANALYPLSDKSMLVLTVCQEADHNGRICQGRIQPDQYIEPARTTADADPAKDAAKDAAISWLMGQ